MAGMWSRPLAGVVFLGAAMTGHAAHAASLPDAGEEAQANAALVEVAPEAVTRAVRIALGRGAIADGDRDGTISAREATQYYNARFNIMDRDDDQGLSRREFVAAPPPAVVRAAAREREVGQRRGGFHALDLDGNGGIDREEFALAMLWSRRSADAASRHQWRSKVFGVLDRSGDGVLSRQEFAAAGERHFAESDADGDGRVTIWEFMSGLRF